MAKYDAATEGRSGDAGVLSDKVRWLAPAAARAECVNEGIPFLFIAKTAVSMQFFNFVVGREDITWVINFFYGSLLYSTEIDLILWLLKSHILTPFLHTNIKVNQNQLELCENYSAGEITMMLMIKRCVDQYGCNL